MSETTDQGKKKTLTLGKKLDVKKSVESDQVRQSFAHGRSKTVAVEVKRKRVIGPGDKHQGRSSEHASLIENNPALANLTEGELETRLKVLQDAMKAEAIASEERARKEKEDQEKRLREELERKQLEETLEAPKISELESTEIEKETIGTEEESSVSSVVEEEIEPRPSKETVSSPQPSKIKTKEPVKPVETKHVIYRAHEGEEEEDGIFRKRNASKEVKRVVTPVRKEAETPRKLNRNVLTRVLEDEDVQRGRSMASLRRARQKQSKQSSQQTENVKVIREVTIPDFISVGELANRMAVRSAEVIKSLMKLGMMVTINQMIDADTAELLCTEFGHKCKRVSESDIEIGLGHQEDFEGDLLPRAPVVTVMGHVDHGKTSLLDALRSTDIVSGEAGGITQHIGAYQVTMKSGQKITFVDTPGHAAFTEMRARGANITDIVVLVVAADDGIMEQTIEAINHAKAAEVPIIVAINKIDKPEANPDRVRNELLNQGIVLEDFGGDVLSVEVSAKQRLNLEKLEEAILLQAEILDLKANPSRLAEGAVIEAKIDRGRGTVATVLVQRGSLKVGDIFVAGTEWGRVRALIDDRGNKIEVATPSMPVEILGFNGVPAAGDEFFVVDSESRAREISEYRQRRDREAKAVASARTTMEQMMSKIASGEAKELAVVIKSDVQGSLEAIASSLSKLGTDEVSVNILHGAVGGISESDITLARASGGIIIGFNVRANPQARELARRDGVDIRYYSIIYDVIDDIKAMMGGLLAPTLREKFLGTAEIREIFNIPKVGKIAGCYVTEGMVKRGAKVRLLRDNVVIHEGTLKTLKRFKDEVKEVKESYECGMAFENYNDIRMGDVIECFEMESIARQL